MQVTVRLRSAVCAIFVLSFTGTGFGLPFSSLSGGSDKLDRSALNDLNNGHDQASSPKFRLDDIHQSTEQLKDLNEVDELCQVYECHFRTIKVLNKVQHHTSDTVQRAFSLIQEDTDEKFQQLLAAIFEGGDAELAADWVLFWEIMEKKPNVDAVPEEHKAKEPTAVHSFEKAEKIFVYEQIKMELIRAKYQAVDLSQLTSLENAKITFQNAVERIEMYQRILSKLKWFDVKVNEYESLADMQECDDYAALAVYIDSYHQTGWYKLWVQTSSKVKPEEAMYGAGYLEGSITQSTMYDSFINMRSDWFEGQPIPNGLLKFIMENIDYIQDNTKGAPFFDDKTERLFWGTVSLTMDQLAGLYRGYSSLANKKQQLSPTEIYMLSADGDLETLVPMYNDDPKSKQQNSSTKKSSVDDSIQDHPNSDHCSSLIKVLDDGSDILMGHATWDHYGLMIRQLKSYNFTLACSPFNYGVCDNEFTRVIAFSSTPGFLWSLDDFYVTNAGLYVMETTNTNYNEGLKDLITPHSVPCWIRGLVGLVAAETPSNWADLFSMHNSGTYDSQWMILDLKAFEPGKDLPDGSFYVLEQIPGHVVSQDKTRHLNEHGFWSSYNVPYFPEIYKMSGWEGKYNNSGGVINDEFSYELCPRAQIFKQQQQTVVDMDSFKHVMRYNGYLTDSESKGNPGNSIAGRRDLYGPKPELDGAIDAKVTNVKYGLALSFDAICGPTTENGLHPFVWEDKDNKTSHLGMPSIFNYTWVGFESRNFAK